MPRLLIPLALLLLALSAGPASAQEPAPIFEFEERVSAFDVMLEIDRSAFAEWLRDRPATGKIGVDDVVVRYGGEEGQVVAVEPPADRRDNALSAWALVLYFDLSLSASRTVRWSASQLAEQAEELTRLGEVELVVADPEPRILFSGRDVGHLEGSLSNLALTGTGTDQLVELRLELLSELDRAQGQSEVVTPETSRQELASAFALEEERLVRRQQDSLISFLHRRSGLPPRRALFLVSDGYDMRPENFYAASPASETESSAPKLGDPVPDGLVHDTDQLARTLAAYGWSVFAFKRPPAEVAKQKKGFRIGKLRFRPALGIIGLAASYEEDRKPELADAYVDLGDAHHRDGRVEDAEVAYRRAIFHYYGDPRTARRQAQALNKLGNVLEAQQREREANAVYQAAADLAPGLASPRLDTVDADLLDPLRPLLILADTSAGGLILEETALPASLESLSQRVRVSYQVSGRPDGQLRPLEVRLAEHRSRLRHPAWARFSTPERVATARVRRLFDGDDEEGQLWLDATPGEGGEVLRLELEAMADSPDDRLGPVLRISWASEESDGVPRVHHLLVQVEGHPSRWLHSLPLATHERPGLIAVTVEDLTTGLFGSAEVDL